jgi:hypothetical protein
MIASSTQAKLSFAGSVQKNSATIPEGYMNEKRNFEKRSFRKK